MTVYRADLLSDTLTAPTEGMRAAMAAAPVGDDVFGEDPTVRTLEEEVADLLGHEAALFTPSGSMANQLGLRLHAGPGQELLADSGAHVVRAELGAAAAFSGITSRTWRSERGLLDPRDALELVTVGCGPYQVETSLVVVENTHNFGGGTVQPLEAIRALREATAPLGVAMHLDGARLWNAHVATGVPLADYAREFDTVSVCLSKGLGAPVGSLLVGSAARMAEVIDHVLAILPFEPPLMRAAGMSCDFVGHPIVAEPVAGAEQAAAFRAAHGIAADAPLVLCLPGSRRGEVARLGPRFDEALIRLRDRIPEIRVVLPTVPGVSLMVREMVRRWPVAPVMVETGADKRAAFAGADLALAASGTVSLELAANRVPMVIGYDMAPLSRWVIGWLLRTDTVTLVSLVSGTRAVPEFLGRACQPGPMAASLHRLMEDPEARKEQLAAMALTMERLGRDGEAPGLRAARSVLGALGRG